MKYMLIGTFILLLAFLKHSSWNIFFHDYTVEDCLISVLCLIGLFANVIALKEKW